jgi:arylsulfatase A-like enzyme
VDFIKQGHKEPFLLGVSLHNPHDICYVPRKYDHFPEPVNMNSAPPLPENHKINPGEPEFLQQCRNRDHYGNELAMARDFTDEQWRTYLFHYYRMTERVDKEIGKVIKALEYMAIEENTLIIFTSDHGDGVASHKWAAKLSLYQEAANIPMIVTWFGKTPENVCDDTHLVSGLDVLPTMCDYAGVEPPLDILGKSLRTIIEDPTGGWRDYVITELAPDTKKPEMKGRMVRTARYKYNLYSHGERNEQLFDLKNDPGETGNLAYHPDYKSVKEKHRNILDEWMEKTGDDFNLNYS